MVCETLSFFLYSDLSRAVCVSRRRETAEIEMVESFRSQTIAAIQPRVPVKSVTLPSQSKQTQNENLVKSARDAISFLFLNLYIGLKLLNA